MFNIINTIKQKIPLPLILSFIFIVLSFSKTLAIDVNTIAKSALVIDYDTGAILYQKNASSRMAPASMSKLLTIYVIFEELRSGNITLETKFLVSKKAWKKGGSKMFVESGKQVSVIDLLRGIIIQSGNDACIVIAEGLAGDEDRFALQMNKTAERIWLRESNFKNSTGWPDEEHYTTPNDLALLVKRIIYDFPEYYYLFAEKSFTFSDIKQSNRNPLLFNYPYSDGLKTGHTEASGYGLAASATKNNRRIILVLNGLNSKKERKDESIKLLDWAFREFVNIDLFDTNEDVIQADVWLGEDDLVGLISRNPIKVTVSKNKLKNINVKVIYESPIKSPINLNDSYAKLFIDNTVQGDLIFPLYANKDIKKAGAIRRIFSALSYIIFGAYAE